MEITRTSILTNVTRTANFPSVTLEQYQSWQNGTLIQDAFPQLTPDEREFIKTGVTPEEWDAAFNGE